MGREIRRVPPNWQHPQTELVNSKTGRMEKCFQPLYDRPYIEAISDWIKNHEAWESAVHERLTKGDITKSEYPHYAAYGGNAPSMEDYRPNWRSDEMTWWQVYETVTEGTPVTPPFATREELVQYLVANGDFWDQKRRSEGNSNIPCGPWSLKQAQAFVFGSGWAPSMVVSNGRAMSGVEAVSEGVL
jgi:hypothetical protein